MNDPETPYESPDDFLDDAEIEEVNKFLNDPRATRYVHRRSNTELLRDYLWQHSLDWTHQNSFFAYCSLQDMLELLPILSDPADAMAAASAPQPEPSPVAPIPARSQREPVVWRNGKLIPYTHPVRL